MNIWENTVLTDKGKALQAKLLNGQTLKIRRVATGAKKVPVVDLRQQINVSEGGYDIDLQPVRTEGEKTIIPVLLENKDLKESYELWQVGFYAEDPDEGEILFCLAQAAQAKNIPSEAESPGYSITWNFYFNTANDVPFEVVLNPVGLVNIEAYQVHTEKIKKINEEIERINVDLPEFDMGYTGDVTCNASGNTEVIVRFNKTFSNVPRVMVTSYLSGYMRGIAVANISKTGCKILFANTTGSSIVNSASWIAIGFK